MKEWKLLFCFVAMSMISGCVGVIAAGAATGAVINDTRSIEMMEKDTRIKHEVGLLLTRNKALKSSHIVVSSYHQMVFIGGEVPKASLAKLAEKLTLSVPDVKRVYNQIEVGPNNGVKGMAYDAWLTTSIKTKMLAKRGLRAGGIKVITEKSAVYLLGKVTHDQANLAVDVARHTKGVVRVVKLFSYTD